MVFIVTRFPEESIALVSVEFPLERYLPHWHTIDDQLQTIAVETPGQFYVILDLRGQDLAFSDVLLIIEEQRFKPTPWLYAPTVRVLVVGNHPVIPVGLKRLNEQLNLHVEHFSTMAAALARIRTEPA